jgi:hypothetical protein
MNFSKALIIGGMLAAAYYLFKDNSILPSFGGAYTGASGYTTDGTYVNTPGYTTGTAETSGQVIIIDENISPASLPKSSIGARVPTKTEIAGYTAVAQKVSSPIYYPDTGTLSMGGQLYSTAYPEKMIAAKTPAFVANFGNKKSVML